jgi:hypothetical protein
MRSMACLGGDESSSIRPRGACGPVIQASQGRENEAMLLSIVYIGQWCSPMPLKLASCSSPVSEVPSQSY